MYIVMTKTIIFLIIQLVHVVAYPPAIQVALHLHLDQHVDLCDVVFYGLLLLALTAQCTLSFFFIMTGAI